jgi:hypothetical protein
VVNAMKCLIFAKKNGCEWVQQYFPGVNPYLLKVVNKPLIEYYIDHCYEHKVDQIRIVSNFASQEIRQLCGNGEKWGLKITYSLARENDDLDHVIKKNKTFCADDSLLIMDGLQFLTYKQDKSSYLIEPLDSIECYYKLSLKILANLGRCYALPGYTKDEDIYIGQNVEIARSAELESPFSIGDNVLLQDMTVIRENSVIGSNVIVSRGTKIQNSLVYDGTFIGPELNIKSKIVYKNRIIEPLKGTVLPISDVFIVSEVPKFGSLLWLKYLIQSSLALAMMIVMVLPFLIVITIGLLRRNITLKTTRYFRNREHKTVTISSIEFKRRTFNARIFRRFSLDKFPFLFSILKGKIDLVGNALLVESLESRNIIRELDRYKAGVFSYREFAENDETLDNAIIHEQYYNMNRSFLKDLKLVVKIWFFRIVN